MTQTDIFPLSSTRHIFVSYLFSQLLLPNGKSKWLLNFSVLIIYRHIIFSILPQKALTFHIFCIFHVCKGKKNPFKKCLFLQVAPSPFLKNFDVFDSCSSFYETLLFYGTHFYDLFLFSVLICSLKQNIKTKYLFKPPFL